jgi:hypothetical protein
MSDGINHASTYSGKRYQPSTASRAEIAFRYAQQLGGGSFVKALQGVDSLILHLRFSLRKTRLTLERNFCTLKV